MKTITSLLLSKSKNCNDQIEGLDSKARYTEVGLNYRFFLNWRHFVLAGFFVLQGFLLNKTLELLEKQPLFSCILAIIAGALSLAFFGFDKRIRRIYDAAIKIGVTLEGSSPGFYKSIDVRPDSISHSEILNIVYLVSMGIQFCFAVYILLCRYFLICVPN